MIYIYIFNAFSGYEEAEKEKKRPRTAQVIRVKEEQPEETRTLGTDGDATRTESQQDQDSLNLFLQKPGSFSKLSKLLEVAKMAQDSDINSHNSLSAKVPTAASYPSYPTSQTATSQQGLTDKTDTSAFKSSPWITGSPQLMLHEDQLSKVLTEKSNQWFSLFPRTPCDEDSVTSGSSPPASYSPLQTISTKSPSSLSPNPSAASSSSTPAGINNVQSSVLQVGG